MCKSKVVSFRRSLHHIMETSLNFNMKTMSYDQRYLSGVLVQ